MSHIILCLSGGIDSLIAYHYLGRPATVFFDTGGYADAERKAVLKIAPNTIIDTTLDFSSIAINENAFIPNRNLLFAARASSYASTVYLAGLKDDMVSDKNQEAFEAMSKVLRKISSQKGQYAPIVASPFWEFTKSSIVEWFLEAVPNAEQLLKDTISCYNPTEDGKECKACPSCFRKWNALWDNHIKTDFVNLKLMEDYLERAKNGDYISERNKSIIDCVEDYINPKPITDQKIYCFDIDGVFTNEIEGHDYTKRTPNIKMINEAQKLYNGGAKIVLHSARYPEDLQVTKKWLADNKVFYHEIHLGKPKADFYIDDKMLPMEELTND